MSAPTTKEKGDLLEDVITGICSGLKDSKVTRNAEIDGPVRAEVLVHLVANGWGIVAPYW